MTLAILLITPSQEKQLRPKFEQCSKLWTCKMFGHTPHECFSRLLNCGNGN